MKLNNGLIYTNENCVGCNKCISGCPILGANVAERKNNNNVIVVDGSKCIHCGHCLSICEHDARRYRDDTERFLNDIAISDSDISVLISSSFAIHYPDEYKKVFGLLLEKGVKQIYNIDFGGRISMWAYFEYIKDNDVKGLISQQCPVVINYIEKHKPELITKLLPIQSPLICAATYLKKYKHISQKFAYIGPCIAKKDEIDDDNTNGIISYNVTYKNLMKEISKYELSRFQDGNAQQVEHGSITFQSPGGISEMMFRYYDEDKFIRVINGEDVLYDYFDEYKNNILDRKDLPDFIEVSNCKNGCNYGTGTTAKFTKDETLLKMVQKQRNALKKNKHTVFHESRTPAKNMKDLKDTFKMLDIKDFLRNYNTGAFVYEKLVSNEEIQKIYKEMGKDTEKAKTLNCGACGYSTCKEMVTAIARGYNHKSNCLHCVKDELSKEKKELSNVIEKMNEAKDEITRVNKAKTDFLAKMSHEIRTPINAITGLTELLVDEEKDEKLKDYACDIKNASGNLLAIINDILDLSKIEAGKVKITNSEYYTEALFKDVVNIMKLPIERKGIKFNVEIDPNISKVLYGDVTRVRQILTNVLNNAFKYTQEGSIDFIATSEKKDEFELLKFIVKDTGIGIKKEDYGKLFSEFEQIIDEKTKGIEGTGLGLPISKNLANLMDGDITVESEYGKGSTFTITLMQKIVKNVTTAIDEKMDEEKQIVNLESKTFGFTIEGANVLVVDDNEINLKVACRILNKYGITPDTATGGVEAIELIKRNIYDIVFMDQMMPDIDGTDATRQIREMDEKYFKELPIIALTANAVTGVKEELLEAGFSDFVSKPIDIKYLEKVLKRWLLSKIISDDAREKYNELIISKRQEFEDKFLKNQEQITIDALLGITNCAGSETIYVDVLETFYEGGEKHINSLEELFKNKEFENYKIEAHGIKSAAANIGAMKLSELAKIQEYAVKEENITALENNHEEFMKELKKVLNLLTPYGVGEKRVYDSAGKIAIDKDDILGGVREVEKYIASSNIMGAVKDLEKVLKFSYLDSRVMEKLNEAKNTLAIEFNIRGGREKIEEAKALLQKSI